MSMVRVALVFCLCVAANADQATSKASPLSQVISMLQGMAAKGKSEKVNEEVEFAKFKAWCSSTISETKQSIEDAEAKITELNADIDKAEADAETLAEEIAELEATIAKNEKSAQNATEIREKERADYVASHQDFSESIDAIKRALQVLSTRTADIPQSLAQLQSSRLISNQAKTVIASFLSMSQASEAGAPEANAYEFQSGSVISMLEKLQEKFKDQLLGLEKAEIAAKSNYQMLMQQLTDDIKYDKKCVADKTGARAGQLEDAAAAKGDLAITEKGKAEDEKTLADALSDCHARSEEFEKNQVLRAEEIKAIEEATKILQSDAVSGAAKTYLPAASLIQKATSLGQLRSQPSSEAIRRRIVEFLQGRAQKTGSRYLALLATKAAEDPFGKVKQMIKDLIVKLMEEANEEADKKAFCDTELATNKQTRENKQAEVDELTANVEKLTAESTQLAEEIKDLSDAIADLRVRQAEATEMRNNEKATNEQTVADAKAAQEAVERATKVLKDYYAKAADSSLIQEPYKGMQTMGGNLVDFLEVVLSDFARLETETSSAEDQAVAEYEAFMNESNEDIAVKDTEMKHKENKKAECDQENAALKKQLELTQEELDAALEYYEKLKPDCIDTGLSYEDRKKAREEEVASLQEALKILNQQDLD